MNYVWHMLSGEELVCLQAKAKVNLGDLSRIVCHGAGCFLLLADRIADPTCVVVRTTLAMRTMGMGMFELCTKIMPPSTFAVLFCLHIPTFRCGVKSRKAASIACMDHGACSVDIFRSVIVAPVASNLPSQLSRRLPSIPGVQTSQFHF